MRYITLCHTGHWCCGYLCVSAWYKHSRERSAGEVTLVRSGGHRLDFADKQHCLTKHLEPSTSKHSPTHITFSTPSHGQPAGVGCQSTHCRAQESKGEAGTHRPRALAVARRKLLSNAATLGTRTVVGARVVPRARARVRDVGLVLLHHVLRHLDEVVEKALDCRRGTVSARQT